MGERMVTNYCEECTKREAEIAWLRDILSRLIQGGHADNAHILHINHWYGHSVALKHANRECEYRICEAIDDAMKAIVGREE